MTVRPPARRGATSAAVKWRHLGLLSLAELLAMSLWFSASAVVPQLTREWNLNSGEQSWLTMSVQLGFVTGALLSAVWTLADRIAPSPLIALSAACGALCNGLILPAAGDLGLVLGLRFMTGMALAGVYPPGMKLVATWCRHDRGLGIGLLVGALTFGSALPHLVNALAADGNTMPSWRGVLLVSSLMAGSGALLVRLFVRSGPELPQTAPFNWRFATRGLRDRPARLANFGYLGHMWELYAMWTWVPVLLLASYETAGWTARAARLAGFATVAAGAIGSVLAGKAADRIGRTTVTSLSLAASGSCCLLVGTLVARPGLLTALCLFWGFAVVADSAQFSAAISELTDERYVGTALTVQTCLGFLLTVVSIRLVPPLVEVLGWQWVFVALAAGPAFGLWSMLSLRRLPAARQMAGGRR